ncbi:MAG TPA: hypothetical protein PKY81_10890 [bacterium]|mgnify:CR=1 FL=1|nr:hypothetical protein [bacterium]
MKRDEVFERKTVIFSFIKLIYVFEKGHKYLDCDKLYRAYQNIEKLYKKMNLENEIFQTIKSRPDLVVENFYIKFAQTDLVFILKNIYDYAIRFSDSIKETNGIEKDFKEIYEDLLDESVYLYF